MGAVHYILGAPGSGKSTLIESLQAALPHVIVLDWDALMNAATGLTGRSIRRNPDSWAGYDALMRAVVQMLSAHPVALLGVRTSDELPDWPIGNWFLLDCGDEERRRRLTARGETPEGVKDALADAASYRDRGLPTIDTSSMTPDEVAIALASAIRGDEQVRVGDARPNNSATVTPASEISIRRGL